MSTPSRPSPSSSRTYGSIGEQDVPSILRLVHHAFATPPDAEEKWIRPAGLQHFRAVREREGASPTSCLLRIPMGQHFGGKPVSMVGVAAVAVAPEDRGRGTARWMMCEAMREAHRDGFALSTLYASTQGLYRQAGYEQAGHRCVTKLLPHRIDVRAREPLVRPLTAQDDHAMAECYARHAAGFSGTLARGPYVWRRVREFRDKKYHGFGIDAPAERGGGLEGYVFLNQSRVGDGIELDVSDMAFLTPRAGQRLLGFLADFSTTTREITLAGPPLHPAVSLMTSHHHTIAKSEVWMMRITDAARALTDRGYPRGVSATIQLNIHDPIVRENDGSWTLHVEHGRAEVRREAAMRPAISCGIGALAAIYSGLYTASQGVQLGWIEGDPGALEAIDAVFGGFGTPWMTDFF
jgi:predicted acetyltransferase